jgi:signal transduction histidine kinase
LTEEGVKKKQIVDVYLKSIKIDNVVSFLVTLRDVSTLLELYEAQSFSKYKSVLLATASHELRNPLNGLISSLELLEPFVTSEG